MAKLVTKRTTTTVTEEVELVPAPAGAEIGHRFFTVSGYGDYYAADGSRVTKPQINLNAKWLADAGFGVGEKIDVEVKENELVIRKMAVGE